MLNTWGSRLAASIVLSISILLSACGGGSSSSNGGGSSGVAKSSSIVISLPGGLAMQGVPQRSLNGAEAISLAIADLLISDAWAAVYEVYVDGIDEGDTDAAGYLVVPVDDGGHTVCVKPSGGLQPYPPFPHTPNSYCIDVFVGTGDVVVVEISDFSELNDCGPTPVEGCFITGTVTNVNEVSLYQDPSKPNHTIVCHKPGTPAEKTLSIGTSAVGSADVDAVTAGHLGHGDTLDSCPDDAPAVTDENVTGNNGNNGNNGNDNRCDNGKPDKKGCSSGDQG